MFREFVNRRLRTKRREPAFPDRYVHFFCEGIGVVYEPMEERGKAESDRVSGEESGGLEEAESEDVAESVNRNLAPQPRRQPRSQSKEAPGSCSSRVCTPRLAAWRSTSARMRWCQSAQFRLSRYFTVNPSNW